MSEEPDLNDEQNEIEFFVDDFASRFEAGDDPDLPRFSENVPSGIRSAVRDRCQRILDILGGIDQPSATGLPEQLGDFRLLERIGKGGMGEVWLADEISLNRKVALKVMRGLLPVSQRQLEQFRREATAVARLHHPGIVPVYRFDEVDGISFIVMEFVEGDSLGDRLTATRDRLRPSSYQEEFSSGATPGGSPDRDVADDAPPPADPGWPREVAEMAAAVADALAHAHDHRIVHRDITPRNIMIGVDGRPRVLDFGLAKHLDQDSVARSDEIVGTYSYMSPEQARARHTTVDHRTDIFSLGTVIYEMLTLKRPFRGATSHQIIHQIAFVQPVSIRKVNPRTPRDLEVICMKCLEKRPEHRYQSAEALAQDLRRFLNHEAILAVRPNPLTRVMRHAVRRPVGYVAAAVAATVAVVAILVTASLRDHRELRRRLGPLEVIASARDLTAMDVGVLAARREEAESLDRRENLPQDARDTVQAVLRKLDEEAGRREVSGRESLARGQGSPPGTEFGEFEPPSDRDYFRGLFQLWEADRIRGRDEPPDDTVRSTFPTITVAGVPDGAEVWYRQVRWLRGGHGAWMRLGTLPGGPYPVPPGEYRFTVIVRGVGFAEMTRDLTRRGEKVVLRPVITATAPVTGPMIRIPAGPARVGKRVPKRDYPHWGPREVDVPEFFIDRTEVTCEEYQAYLEEKRRAGDPRPNPKSWPNGYQAAWAKLPVIGVSYYDARAYAEHHGKRLPTDIEWQKAGRGRAGLQYPPGITPANVKEALGDFVMQRENPDVPIPWHYGTHAVGTMARDRSEYGVMDMFGNVREWTDSPFVLSTPSGFFRTPTDRLVRSFGWTNNPNSFEMDLFRRGPVWMTYIGFRCAKSVRIP